LLICRDALPGVLAAIRSLERTLQAGETEGQQAESMVAASEAETLHPMIRAEILVGRAQG
jgi:hypothetical protein